MSDQLAILGQTDLSQVIDTILNLTLKKMSLRERLKSLYNNTYCVKFLFHIFFSKTVLCSFCILNFFPPRHFVSYTLVVLSNNSRIHYTHYTSVITASFSFLSNLNIVLP